jgi:hypothetical protein
MNVHHRNLRRVVIIGGGFGGLEAAKALRKAGVRITLLDRQNHHLFQPLLYQVAAAALSPADIAEPLRHILRHQENTEVILTEAKSIDVAGKRVITSDGPVEYDFLIVAAGARHSYFGRDEWEQFAPGLKTLDDALDIRRRMLMAFEIAEKTNDAAEREAAMTFVVVGGGLADLKSNTVAGNNLIDIGQPVIDSVAQRPRSDDTFHPVITGEINYTFGGGWQAFFGTSLEDAVTLDGVTQLGARKDLGSDGGVLQGGADAQAHLAGVAVHVPARHARTARARTEKRGQHAHGGGFAGAVRPEESVDLSAGHAQVDAVDGAGRTEGARQPRGRNGGVGTRGGRCHREDASGGGVPRPAGWPRCARPWSARAGAR